MIRFNANIIAMNNGINEASGSTKANSKDRSKEVIEHKSKMKYFLNSLPKPIPNLLSSVSITINVINICPKAIKKMNEYLR